MKGGLEDPILQLALPLGISFYLSADFLADAYKGEVGACSLKGNMSCSFPFSIYVVGPILCQCRNAAAVSANRSAASGLGKACGRTASVCAGAVKKVLLADTFSKAVDAGMGNVAGCRHGCLCW